MSESNNNVEMTDWVGFLEATSYNETKFLWEYIPS